MVEELIKKHTIDKLLKNAEKINIPDKSKYLSAYEEFIEYFNRIDTLTEHHTIIGISFTYSWMPTILHLYSDNVSIIKATEVLNKAKKGTRPNKEELELLKRCFNNSIVGTSKLLHFIDPDKYAIWDSKVYYYLFEKTSTTAPNNIDAYLNYLDFCDHLIKNEPEKIKKLQEIVKDKIGYGVSKMRAIELVFFYNSNNITASKPY